MISDPNETTAFTHKNISPFRDTEWNQVEYALAKKPGESFIITSAGTVLFTFKVTSSTACTFNITFRDIEPRSDVVDVNNIEQFNGTATATSFGVSTAVDRKRVV